jgi:hypothetical protein
MSKVNQDLAHRFTSQGFFCHCELLQVTLFGGYLSSPGFHYRRHIIPSEGYLAPFGDTLPRVETLLDHPVPGLLISFQQGPRRRSQWMDIHPISIRPLRIHLFSIQSTSNPSSNGYPMDGSSY